MAKLTAKQRNALPKGDFALKSERAYPINDKSHARAALSMVSAHGSQSEKAQVRKKVRQEYPEIAQRSERTKRG